MANLEVMIAAKRERILKLADQIMLAAETEGPVDLRIAARGRGDEEVQIVFANDTEDWAELDEEAVVVVIGEQ